MSKPPVAAVFFYYEWKEAGEMTPTPLTSENFDACFELSDFIYGNESVYAEDLWNGETEPSLKMYRKVWKAAGKFRKDTAASWSVTATDNTSKGNRKYRYSLILQDDGTIYIASATLFENDAERENYGDGFMGRLLKVTADDTEEFKSEAETTGAEKHACYSSIRQV